MLQFWYSERCTRNVKLMITIAICVMTMLLSKVSALPSIWVGICVVVGVFMHLIYQFGARRPYTKLLVWILPVGCLTALGLQPSTVLWAWIGQGLGFMILGLFIMSIYQNRAKRFD
ncbi:hypothetical protein [Acinetobacter sp. ANC 5502]